MISAAFTAFDQIFTPPFRTVLWKSVGLTIGLLVLVWIALLAAVGLIAFPFPWLETAASILTGIGALVGLAFLVAPVTSLFAGLFLDEIAEEVERLHYPDQPVGRPVPILRAMATAIGFFGVVVLVNLIALPLVFLVGFGFLIFFFANGYLLGREYFELAALRHHDRRRVRAMRARHGARIFMSGLVIAGFLAVPLLNLLTPLFATAFMVHVYKRIDALDGNEALGAPA